MITSALSTHFTVRPARIPNPRASNGRALSPAAGSLPVLTRFDRLELKYALAPDQVALVAAALAARLQADAHGTASGCYQVTSLYFDNAEHDLYWEQVRRTDLRRKLRVRVYRAGDRPPLSFVEIKQRVGPRTAKRRAALPVPAALSICRGQLTAASPTDDSGAQVVSEAASLAAERRLAPACLVRYDRQAFVGDHREPDLRVTIDQNIVYRLDRLEAIDRDLPFRHRLLQTGAAILEIKVAETIPDWLAADLAELGLASKGASKYGQIMARALGPSS